ncbi:MAG: hypothetical protein WCP09_02285 [Candidatus Taylorbacteria bacterium]
MNNKVVLPTVTIDELAVMIKIGFDEVHSEFRIVHKEISLIKADIVVMKKDIVDIHGELYEVKSDIKCIKRDMATKDDVHELESHLMTTDRTVYKDHAPRLRKLEHSLAVA